MKYQKRLKDLREDNDLKQDTIAKYLGIKQTVYSRYERGQNEIPIHHFIEICKFYNISSDYILGFTDIPKMLPKDGKDI